MDSGARQANELNQRRFAAASTFVLTPSVGRCRPRCWRRCSCSGWRVNLLRSAAVGWVRITLMAPFQRQAPHRAERRTDERAHTTDDTRPRGDHTCNQTKRGVTS